MEEAPGDVLGEEHGEEPAVTASGLVIRLARNDPVFLPSSPLLSQSLHTFIVLRKGHARYSFYQSF